MSKRNKRKKDTSRETENDVKKINKRKKKMHDAHAIKQEKREKK